MCTAGTRLDPTISGGFKNHIALVYWGMTSVAGQCGPFNGLCMIGIPLMTISMAREQPGKCPDADEFT